MFSSHCFSSAMRRPEETPEKGGGERKEKRRMSARQNRASSLTVRHSSAVVLPDVRRVGRKETSGKKGKKKERGTGGGNWKIRVSYGERLISPGELITDCTLPSVALRWSGQRVGVEDLQGRKEEKGKGRDD